MYRRARRKMLGTRSLSSGAYSRAPLALPALRLPIGIGAYMKMIALAGALCLLVSSSTLCKANSDLWCAPDVVIATFKNQQGRDLATIELRSIKAVCSRNPEKMIEASLERSMRIEHHG